MSDALKLVAYWLANLVTVFPFFLLVSSASSIQVSVQLFVGFPWFPTFPGRLGWSEATVMFTITSTIPLPPTFSHFQCFFSHIHSKLMYFQSIVIIFCCCTVLVHTLAFHPNFVWLGSSKRCFAGVLSFVANLGFNLVSTYF